MSCWLSTESPERPWNRAKVELIEEDGTFRGPHKRFTQKVFQLFLFLWLQRKGIVYTEVLVVPNPALQPTLRDTSVLTNFFGARLTFGPLGYVSAWLNILAKVKNYV